MQFTWYFLNVARENHLEARRTDWIQAVLDNPEEIAEDRRGRKRLWGYIGEQGRYMRVVILSDGETVHNAFFDRNYTRRRMREARE